MNKKQVILDIDIGTYNFIALFAVDKIHQSVWKDHRKVSVVDS